MRRARSLFLIGLGLLAPSCATTTHYARRPETDRSSFVAAGAIRGGMTFEEVVVTMIHSRMPGQYAALASGAKCPEVSSKVILHAGELLAKVGRTSVHAGGYASIEVYRRADTSLTSHGYARQGPLLEAVHARQSDLLCPEAVLSFDARVEGGCGEDALLVTFGADGRVSSVGPVIGGSCGAEGSQGG